MMDDDNNRNEYNKSLSLIKKLILSGFSEENFEIIQEQMNLIKPYTDPQLYMTIGSMIRDSFTDNVDVKELNQLMRNMKLNAWK